MTLRVGETEHSQILRVLKDPDSGGSLQDIAVQFALAKEIAADIRTAEGITRQIDTIRARLDTLLARRKDDPEMEEGAELREEADNLLESLTALADSLVQQKPGGFFSWPVKLTSKMIYLANHVQSSDHAPTQQAREAHAVLRELLAVAEGEFLELVREDLARFNDALRQRGIPVIEVEPPGG